MDWKAQPISVALLYVIDLRSLTEVFETTMVCSETEVADSEDTYMMAVHEKIICFVSNFKDGIGQEVSTGMSQHQFVIQMVWLIIPIPTEIQYKRVYKYINMIDFLPKIIATRA